MTRINPDSLHAWSTQALATVGVPNEDAAHIARCLVDVDLRGVRTHGTRQLRRYVNEFRDGKVNPTPSSRLLRETDNSLRFDGDGGAGYLVAARATDAACERAQVAGIVLASTCNHSHVGSAGIYARRALRHGLISWCVAGGTGWQRTDKLGATIWDAMMAPPMCFAVPADDGGPPLVLDMNANQFGTAAQAEAAIAAGFGKSVFGSLGMRFVSTLLGGVLAGTTDQREQPRAFPAATRGFFLVVIDPALVGDADAFRTDVRRVIDASLSLRPLAGTDVAAVPGTLEWRREQDWAVAGIPIPDDHRDALEEIAMEFGLDLPAWIPSQ
jgi:LDH2 family malate/lactate/ureidoglycolate dehydrogenase